MNLTLWGKDFVPYLHFFLPKFKKSYFYTHLLVQSVQWEAEIRATGCLYELFPIISRQWLLKDYPHITHFQQLVFFRKNNLLFRELLCELQPHTVFLRKILTDSCQLQTVKQKIFRTHGFSKLKYLNVLYTLEEHKISNPDLIIGS